MMAHVWWASGLYGQLASRPLKQVAVYMMKVLMIDLQVEADL